MNLRQTNCYFGPNSSSSLEFSASRITSKTDLTNKIKSVRAISFMMLFSSVVFITIYIIAAILDGVGIEETATLLAPSIACFLFGIFFRRFKSKLQECKISLEISPRTKENRVLIVVDSRIEGDCLELAIFDALGNAMSHASTIHYVLVVKCVFDNAQHYLPIYWSKKEASLIESANKIVSATGLTLNHSKLKSQQIDWTSFTFCPTL